MLWRLVAGCIVGVPLGVFALTSLGPVVLRTCLGICMLAFVFERVVHDVRTSSASLPGGTSSEGGAGKATDKVPGTINAVPGAGVNHTAPGAGADADETERWWLNHPATEVGVGLLAGLLHGAVNQGGPPAVILLTLKGWSKDVRMKCIFRYGYNALPVGCLCLPALAQVFFMRKASLSCTHVLIEIVTVHCALCALPR